MATTDGQPSCLTMPCSPTPEHKAAKELLARTYDQMGYMAEAATWRNSYLTAAAELRNGPPKKGIDRAGFVDMLTQTPVERFLEAMAAGLDGPAAEGKDLKMNLVLSGHQGVVSCFGSRTRCCITRRPRPPPMPTPRSR